LIALSSYITLATRDRSKTTNSGCHDGKNHPKAKFNKQKKTIHASERYTERVQKLRVEYWTTIGEVDLADLVFIDEAGVNIAMTRHFARSQKGSRAYGDRPSGRGKNVTMIGAMSLKGIIAAQIIIYFK
jgi:DDE superfamily endonuclease